MSYIKEFNYTDILQRRIIYFNALLTTTTLSLIFADLILTMIYYLYYYPVVKILSISVLAGLFIGNLFGRLLFKFIKKYRLIFIISELLFIAIAVLYFLRNQFNITDGELIIEIFNYSPFYIPLFIAVAVFPAGVKINYFVKISCGNFVDDKQGVSKLILFLFSGILLGFSIPVILFILNDQPVWNNLSFLFFILPLCLSPSLFLINLSYDPAVSYSKQFLDDKEVVEEKNIQKDSLVFVYLNFSFILIFVYLVYESVIKFYGDLFYIKYFFLMLSLTGLLSGYLLGSLIKKFKLYIYSEMMFPIFVLSFILFINNYSSNFPFYYGLLLFLPSIIIFGMSLRNSIRVIVENFDHKQRFFIIDFAIMFLPVPILISLSFIEFTYLWYFISLYILAIISVITPGIYIINSKIKGYKKILYFMFVVFSIIGLIFANNYFKINLTNDIYVTRTKNFDQLKRINYSSLFIKNKGTIIMNNSAVFNISDSLIRNMKRSLVPVSLFVPENEVNNLLFIDGNQKFFRNPVIGFFKNSICLDPISESNVDFNKLPLSGNQKYISENDYLMLYLQKRSQKFYAVVDIPNILDQNFNHFKFSEEYYKTIKKHIKDTGIYIQVLNINNCRDSFFSTSIKNLKKTYKNHLVFLFSNIIVIVSSNYDRAFKIVPENLSRLQKFYTDHDELKILFYNEFNILTHLVFDNIDDLLSFVPDVEVKSLFFLNQPESVKINTNLFKNYLNNNNILLKLVDNVVDNYKLLNYIKADLANNSNIHTLIKRTELAESNDDYEQETKHLFELKKFTDYNLNLKKYLNTILSYKEKYYYNTGLRLESEKRWDDAKTLYKASITINKNNFESNYRLGLLCIILQDIDSAFKYLQDALILQKDHPKVLYQMGVLFFLNGRLNEAITYLNRALLQKERTALLYLYLGLSNEKLGNLNEAESYYSKAQILDPNDENIKIRLEKIKLKKEGIRDQWKQPQLKNNMEVEHGENFPLPINKSAIEWRLKDKEKE